MTQFFKLFFLDTSLPFAALALAGGGVLAAFTLRGSSPIPFILAGLIAIAGLAACLIILFTAIGAASGRLEAEAKTFRSGTTLLTPATLKRSYHWIGILGALGTFFAPVYTQDRGRPQPVSLSHLRQIGTGFAIYLAENNDCLPRAGIWMDAISPYLKNERLFQVAELAGPIKGSPEIGRGPYYGAAMLSRLSKSSIIDVEDPGHQVLVFESELLHRNASSDLATMAFRWHGLSNNEDLGVVVHCDTSARMVKKGIYSNQGTLIPTRLSAPSKP